MKNKKDMSKICNFKYQENEVKINEGKITDEKYQDWYNNHCGKCQYMNEICMYGENK